MHHTCANMRNKQEETKEFRTTLPVDYHKLLDTIHLKINRKDLEHVNKKCQYNYLL